MMTALTAMLRFSVGQMLRDAKFWLIAAALLLPAALALVVRYLGPPEDPDAMWKLYHVLLQFLFLQALLPLICILHGTALIGAEVEPRTITFLITRQLRRHTVLLTRLGSHAAVLTLVCLVAVVVLHCCVAVGMPGASEQSSQATEWIPLHDLQVYLSILPLGVVAYLSLFTFVGLVSSRPISWSILYLVLFELVVANIPAPVQQYSLTFQLRGIATSAIPELGRLNQLVFVPHPKGWFVLLLVAGSALAFSSFLIHVRELIPTKVARE